MTDPDDLAPTLAEHRLMGWNAWDARCKCGHTGDHTEHLASVVLRRDADLRTRIEDMRDTYGDEASERFFGAVIAEQLRSALDGDTREDAPTRDTVIAGCGHYCSVCGSRERFDYLRSRRPADTDTGSGQ